MDLGSLLSTLTGGAVALVGSWLTLRHELRRFKGQRSFELQVTWYREAVRALLRAARRMIVAASAVEAGAPPEQAQRLIDRQNEALGEAIQLTTEGGMFAGERAAASFRELASAFSGLRLKQEAGQENEELVAVWRWLSGLCAKAAKDLSAEGREILGLDPLSER